MRTLLIADSNDAFREQLADAFRPYFCTLTCGDGLEALEILAKRVGVFELNTGAISRGYRTTPYPSIPILKELKRLGFGAISSSDCHDGRKLDCGFEQARELLLHCGFKEKYILTDSGFRAVEL